MIAAYNGFNLRSRHYAFIYSREFHLFFILFSFALLLIQPVSGFVTIEYFHQAGCVNCEQTDPLIRNISEHYLDRISVKDITVDNREAVRLLISYGRTEIPVVVINHVRVIDWPYITESRLDEEIRLAEAGAYPVTYSGNEKNSLIQSGYLAVIFSFFLGIMTGVSPCLLGSLVVMITATATTAGSATTSRYYATVFGMGLVTAYVIGAAGILFAGFHLPSGAGLSTTFYTVAGLVTIGFGILQSGLSGCRSLLSHGYPTSSPGLITSKELFFSALYVQSFFLPAPERRSSS